MFGYDYVHYRQSSDDGQKKKKKETSKFAYFKNTGMLLSSKETVISHNGVCL